MKFKINNLPTTFSTIFKLRSGWSPSGFPSSQNLTFEQSRLLFSGHSRDVAQWLERRNSNPKTLGSTPCWGRVRTMFLSFRDNSSADLFVPDPSLCVRHAPKCVSHVKDRISICRKRVGFTAGGMETWKHVPAHRKNRKTRWRLCKQKHTNSWVARPYYGCSLSPGKAARISRVLHWEKHRLSILKLRHWTIRKETLCSRETAGKCFGSKCFVCAAL